MVIILKYSQYPQNSIVSSLLIENITYVYSDNDISHPKTIFSTVRDFWYKFTDHINQIVQKVNCVLGLIKCTFTCIDANTIRLLYATLIFPRLLHLECPPFKEHL